MALTAASLSPKVNAYSVDTSPRRIVVPKASVLAKLQDVTVSGQLLKKQLVTLDKKTGTRTVGLAAQNGKYTTSPDGDLHFCLGTTQLKPHIACEVQNAKTIIDRFRAAVGTSITVSGFFRCLFEHPGFRSNDDAHIFEIHPVRAVKFGSEIQSFDVDIPDQNAIHTWLLPHPLNDQDSSITVEFNAATDTLTFTGMRGQDENYVRVPGTVSDKQLNPSGGAPLAFTLTSGDIGHPIRCLCLQGTTAAKQLLGLTGNAVQVIGLRNIDLSEALQNRYTINLLAIDIAG